MHCFFCEELVISHEETYCHGCAAHICEECEHDDPPCGNGHEPMDHDNPEAHQRYEAANTRRHVMRRREEVLSLAEIEKAGGGIAGDWEGRCYHIACVAADLLDGATAVYGHYRGYVNPEGYWHDRATHEWIQHGWVLLADGRVLDPTRFSFENAAPYVYVGENNDDYDEGGNVLAAARMEPPPAASMEGEYLLQYAEEHRKAATDRVAGLLMLPPKHNNGLLTARQLHWLANVPYDMLQPHAWEIYCAILEAGPTYARAFIPNDNFERAEREG